MNQAFSKQAAANLTKAKALLEQRTIAKELEIQKERDRTATNTFANLAATQQAAQDAKDKREEQKKERERLKLEQELLEEAAVSKTVNLLEIASKLPNIDEGTLRKVKRIISDADFTTCKLIQAAAGEFEKDSPERFPEDTISRVSWLL